MARRDAGLDAGPAEDVARLDRLAVDLRGKRLDRGERCAVGDSRHVGARGDPREGDPRPNGRCRDPPRVGADGQDHVPSDGLR